MVSWQRLAVGIVLAGVLVSCVPTTVRSFHPILKTRAELKASVQFNDQLPPGPLGQALLSPDQKFLFVCKPDQGWVVVDVADSSAPRILGFIVLPGSRTAHVFDQKGSLLVAADAYGDLVVLGLSFDPNPKLEEVSRLEAALRFDPNEVIRRDYVGASFSDPIPSDAVAVGYTMTETTDYQFLSQGLLVVKIPPSPRGWPARMALSPGGPGIPERLFVGDQNGLVTFDVTSPAAPNLLGSTPTSGGPVRALAVQSGRLVVEAQDLLLIYDVASNSALPGQVSNRDHDAGYYGPLALGPRGPDARGTAFVEAKVRGTLGEGGYLGLVDTTDPTAEPALLRISDERIRGLGLIAPNRLMVCLGPSGVRLVDVSRAGFPVIGPDPEPVIPSDFDAQSVVAGQVTFLVGTTGIRVYRYQDGSTPAFLLLAELNL